MSIELEASLLALAKSIYYPRYFLTSGFLLWFDWFFLDILLAMAWYKLWWLWSIFVIIVSGRKRKVSMYKTTFFLFEWMQSECFWTNRILETSIWRTSGQGTSKTLAKLLSVTRFEVSLYRGFFPFILLLLWRRISFVIPRTSLFGRSFWYNVVKWLDW